jgi:hypothetical protein
MPRTRCGLLVTAVLLAGATTASASWHLPGGGVGVAHASVDFHAPVVTAATVAPAGMTAAGGAIAPGGQFVVYANVVDVGVSGVAWVRANVSNLKTGATAVALAPCSSGCTVGGTTYGWSTAAQTANAGLAQGTQTYGVFGQDNVGNTGAPASHSVIVDSTKPTISAAVVAMAAPATVGWVHSAGTYAVYANATDGGSPASGIATLLANVSTITTGQTAVALTTCTVSCTAGGVTYAYKSASLAASTVADGSKSFSLTATDPAANATTTSFTATADSTSPTVTAAVVVNTTPSFVGYAKPSAAYVVYANAADTNVATVTANVSGLTSGQTAVPLAACASSCTQGGVTYAYKSASQTAGGAIAQGSTPFSVTATDKAANATTGSYSVTVDSTGPAMSGVAVANTTTSTPGLIKKSGAYIVYANASDSVGVTTVKANVSTITSGQTALALSACASACTVGGVTYGYKSASKTAGSALVAGSLAFTVTATDALSNTTTANGSVTVDNTAPTLSAETVATTVTGLPGFLSQGKTYVVYANATDASGLSTVSANVKNLTTGATAVAMPACASGCTAGAVTYGYTSPTQTGNASITAGSKSYTITVTDKAGNATSVSPTVTIDNTAPTVATTFPTAAYSGGWSAGCGTPATADICGTVSDATSGIASVQVSLRHAAAPSLYWSTTTTSFSSAGELLMPATVSLPNWTFPAATAWFVTNSAYTIRTVATDGAANTATTSTTFTFKP